MRVRGAGVITGFVSTTVVGATGGAPSVYPEAPSVTCVRGVTLASTHARTYSRFDLGHLVLTVVLEHLSETLHRVPLR